MEKFDFSSQIKQQSFSKSFVRVCYLMNHSGIEIICPLCSSPVSQRALMRVTGSGFLRIRPAASLFPNLGRGSCLGFQKHLVKNAIIGSKRRTRRDSEDLHQNTLVSLPETMRINAEPGGNQAGDMKRSLSPTRHRASDARTSLFLINGRFNTDITL